MFFSKETLLVYPKLQILFKEREKQMNVNDFLALSLVGIMVCVYSIGKKFYFI